MPNCVNSPILQYADDVKMLQVIGGAADFQQLRADINSFVNWFIKWQLMCLSVTYYISDYFTLTGNTILMG